MSEHRVSMLGPSWRHAEDPTRSRDPRIRAVVGALAELPAPKPRAEFRAELRAQLVAITPRVIAESAGTESAVAESAVAGSPVTRPTPLRRPSPAAAGPHSVPAGPARHADGWAARLRAVRLARPLSIAASVIVVLALLLGGAVWMSRKALPGDALYGLKRASEGVELATAGSDSAKARDYLDFARTRAGEVQDLLARSSSTAAGSGAIADGAAIDSHTVQLITSTLGSADSDVTSATSLLGRQAIRESSVRPLATLTSWAPGQLQRLNQITAELPAGALHNQAAASSALVRAAVARVTELGPKIGCSCLKSTSTDSLGPVPCPVCPLASSPPAGPSGGAGVNTSGSSSGPGSSTQSHTGAAPRASSPAPTTSAPGRRSGGGGGTGTGTGTGGGSGNGGGSSGGGGNGGGGGTTTSPAAPGGSSTPPGRAKPSRPALPLPSLTLPALPILPLGSTPPLSVDSCGVNVHLPVLGVHVGVCNGLSASVGG